MAALSDDGFQKPAQNIRQWQNTDGADFGIKTNELEQFPGLPDGQHADMAGDPGERRMIYRQQCGVRFVIVQPQWIAEVPSAGLHE
jgi:hypothetical protein